MRWRGLWAWLAVAVSTVPVAGVFSYRQVFYLRDLSLTFWERHLWLRRSLWSGVWPLWDPYIGAGQSAVADALHQMFFLPALVLRMAGTEVVGFNLWVAAPFPLAALGAYFFLSRRFSRQAAALGAIAFAVSGPVVSTGNMPNLSWSVAAMPWVLWAADRAIRCRRPADFALLSAVFALQALAGEPVTLAATGATAVAYALWIGGEVADRPGTWLRGSGTVALALALGMAGAAIQLLPLTHAVADSWRPYGTSKDLWALHPLAVAEMFTPHLFGSSFDGIERSAFPWMEALNSGREPLFYSIYFGTALAAVALFGAIAGWRRPWSGFWSVVGAAALLGALGPHTPFYPFLCAHLPVISSFRFPVKYLVVVALAVAALAAAGWDALAPSDRETAEPRTRLMARTLGATLPLSVAVVGGALLALCLRYADAASAMFSKLASHEGVKDPTAAAAYLVRTIPWTTSPVVLLALAGAFLLILGSARRNQAGLARAALYALVIAELLMAALGLNPTFDARYFQRPRWIEATRGDQQARFYFGGRLAVKGLGDDPDSPHEFQAPLELSPLGAQALAGAQELSFPAVWHAREMLSYDLPVLWPREFRTAGMRFQKAGRQARDTFLWRTGVRYRILPASVGGARPSVPLEFFQETRLFDWGPAYPRVSIVPDAVVVPSVSRQIDLLFDSGFDQARSVALISPEPSAWGRTGRAAGASARIEKEGANEVVVRASVPPHGGYLLLLDSYSPDWRVTVDGGQATLLRADALFRAVRLVPGAHTVVFAYRPASFYWGAAISALAALMMIAIWGIPPRRVCRKDDPAA